MPNPLLKWVTGLLNCFRYFLFEFFQITQISLSAF